MGVGAANMGDADFEKLTKIRLHMRANPAIGKKISEAVAEVASSIGVELSKDTYENLIIIHRSELDTEISVTLPVGSQCGF